MPESTSGSSGDLDAVADELYALPPDEFVPARDDKVAAAKEAGERDLARAIGRLRRPTRAAWLANLLARHRSDQLDGLVALARGLAEAQQGLDGDALRALSGQRHRVVAAMARDAGRLAARRGEAVTEALLRELQGILDAALADPAVAEEVRAGRLTKTVRYSGFGPGDGDDLSAWTAAAPAPSRRPAPAADEPTADADADTDADADQRRDDAASRAREEARERARREKAAAERAEREQALVEAEEQEAAAREQQEDDESARDRADERHTTAKARVAELVAELDTARGEEQEAQEAARAAAAAVRGSAREAAAAAVRTARARSRLEQLPPA